MVVVDASFLVNCLAFDLASGLNRYRRHCDGNVFAPSLIDIETLQAFRRLVRMGHLDAGTVAHRLEALRCLAITRVPVTEFLKRIWQLRDNVTAYDAAYVALAEALACPVVTCDEKLGRTPVPEVTVRVVR